MGELLLGPAGRNAFFVADRFPYMSSQGDWWYRSWGPAASVQGMAIAAAIAIVSARVGIAWGTWMRRVQR